MDDNRVLLLLIALVAVGGLWVNGAFDSGDATGMVSYADELYDYETEMEEELEEENSLTGAVSYTDELYDYETEIEEELEEDEVSELEDENAITGNLLKKVKKRVKKTGKKKVRKATLTRAQLQDRLFKGYKGKKALDNTCKADNECVSKYCDIRKGQSQGKCGLKYNTQSCRYDSQCLTLFCDNKKCALARKAGQTAPRAVACLTGLNWVSGTCVKPGTKVAAKSENKAAKIKTPKKTAKKSVQAKPKKAKSKSSAKKISEGKYRDNNYKKGLYCDRGGHKAVLLFDKSTKLQKREKGNIYNYRYGKPKLYFYKKGKTTYHYYSNLQAAGKGSKWRGRSVIGPAFLSYNVRLFGGRNGGPDVKSYINTVTRKGSQHPTGRHSQTVWSCEDCENRPGSKDCLRGSLKLPTPPKDEFTRPSASSHPKGVVCSTVGSGYNKAVFVHSAFTRTQSRVLTDMSQNRGKFFLFKSGKKAADFSKELTPNSFGMTNMFGVNQAAPSWQAPGMASCKMVVGDPAGISSDKISVGVGCGSLPMSHIIKDCKACVNKAGAANDCFK